MSFYNKEASAILLEISKYALFTDDLYLIDWISKLEVLGERKNNLKDQVLYLNILKDACCDYDMGKNLKRIQKRIRIQLFNIGTNPMKRGVVNFFLNNEGRAIAKIFKPPKLPLTKIIELNPEFAVCNFTLEDNNKYLGDLIDFSSQFLDNATLQHMIIYIVQYIKLMIHMSEETSDESLNQIKNVGLTEKFCQTVIQNNFIHPKIKGVVLELYIILHLKYTKCITSCDDLSYCYERIHCIPLLAESIKWMKINEIRMIETKTLNFEDNVEMIFDLFEGSLTPDMATLEESFKKIPN